MTAGHFLTVLPYFTVAWVFCHTKAKCSNCLMRAKMATQFFDWVYISLQTFSLNLSIDQVRSSEMFTPRYLSSFKYLGVNISEDLTWTTHIQTQVKKARQRLYHLRQLRKFRVSPAILKTFYSGAIESVLTQCISVWYNNATNQDCKALQRVVRLAERISGSALPSLQHIYLKRCRSRAAKILKFYSPR